MDRASLVVASLVVALGTGLTGCGPAQLSATSLCSDYLKRSSDERLEAAVRLSTEFRSMSAGSSMWAANLNYTCGEDPKQTLREAFGE